MLRFATSSQVMAAHWDVSPRWDVCSALPKMPFPCRVVWCFCQTFLQICDDLWWFRRGVNLISFHWQLEDRSLMRFNTLRQEWLNPHQKRGLSRKYVFFSVLFIDFPEQQGLVYRILDITIGTLFVATETPGCCDKIPWLTGRARLRGRPCNRDCQDRMPCFTGLPESTQ